MGTLNPEMSIDKIRQEARCQQPFGASTVGFCIVDRSGVVREADDHCLEWLGYDREEVTASKLRWDELFDPEFRWQAQQAFTEVIESGFSHPFEAQYIHHRGHRVWGLTGGALLARTVPETSVVFLIDTIDDRKIRARIRAVEETYRRAADTAEEGIWLLDAEAHTLYVNSKMAEILGYAASEVMGRSLLAFMDADAQPAAQELFRRRKEGVRERHSFTFRRKDGAAVSTSVATSPIFDTQGRFSGALGFVTDITAQQRDQERLQVNEDRLRLALSASRQGLWDWDVVKDETYLSPTYWELTGYTEGEVRPNLKFFQSIIHPDDRQMVDKTMQEHFQGKSAQSVIEYRMERKTGEYVWIRGVGRVTARDNTGAPLRMLGIIQDISDRKRLETQQRFLAEAGILLSSSLDYEQILSTIAALAVRDFADWCVVDLVDENQNLVRLKVISADPSKADICARLEQLPPDRTKHHLVRAILDIRQSLLLEHVTRDHIEQYAQGPDHLHALLAVGASSLIAVPIQRQNQTFGALVFVSSTPGRVYRNTDLKFAEALADRAAIALENARLYRDSVLATQLREQVLAVVAHDLRNPLNTILLQASRLQLRGLETDHTPMKSIRRAATRMKHLIQDLLDVASIEAGELRVETAKLSVDELVAEVVETQRAHATLSSVDLRLDVEDGLPVVWGDSHRILQVFDNLIGNALKFTGAGGRITIGAASKSDEVVFWVADSGSGIAPEALPHVFDRFWQGKRADHRGAGLGLHIARGIVEAHRGRIWVESALGRGSTFFFSIPTAAGRAQSPQKFIH